MRLGFEDELLQNVEQFGTIANEKLPPNLSEDEVLLHMQDRARLHREVMTRVNSLIDQHLVSVLTDPTRLTDEEADAYAALADRLVSIRHHLDMGLAYPIHKALLRRAEARQDIDREIFHHYWLGLIHLRWSYTLFIEDAIGEFKAAAQYLDRYFEIESKDTRMLLNRCLGNVYVAISARRRTSTDYAEFFEAVDRAIAFWNDPKVRALDPDFPWQGFMLNSHQNICSWLDRMRTTLRDDKYLAERIHQSAETLYGDNEELQSADPMAWSNSRSVYSYYAAKYHAGYINAREITHILRSLYEMSQPDDYSDEGIYRMMNISALMLEYMQFIPSLPQAKLRAEQKTVYKKALAYWKNLPPDTDRFTVNRTLSTYLPGIINEFSMQESIELMLQLTTFSHMPTHVHSIMTSRIMEAIARYFIQTEPARLVGVCGTADALEVTQKKQEILQEIRLAGLAHDAGKSIYIQTVSLCSRRLTDIEYSIIREHTEAGFDIFQDYIPSGCIADVIQGHHKWYDGQGGYPRRFDNTKSPYAFIIDISSVADSIDAATDSIGRSYATQLTLDDVIAEINEQSGTRYNPVIAEALLNPALHEHLKDIVENQRKKVYYAVYESTQRAGFANDAIEA